MCSELSFSLHRSAKVKTCRYLLFATLLMADPGTGAEDGAPRAFVPNFKLLDHRGTSHELYRYKDRTAVVLAMHSIPCGHLGGQTNLDRLARIHERDNIAFLYIDPAPPDFDVMSTAVGKDSLPVLLDRTGEVARILGLDTAGSFVILNTQHWRVHSSGRTEFLSSVIRAFLRGAPAQRAGSDIHLPSANTCRIDLEPTDVPVPYASRIAPLLLRRCVGCHHRGGIAPWAMNSHEMVRGFAPMIREVILNRRMPPWHADPAHGRYVNDRSLSVPEARDLLRWIDAGATKLAWEDDPLRFFRGDSSEWQLGEPDLVIDIPPFEIPASGVVSYYYPSVPNPLTDQQWIKAVEFLPGDRSALHHALVSIGSASSSRTMLAALGNLAGYAPGDPVRTLPDEGGIRLPPGAILAFQMHYTPYGKASVDSSRLGLYFHEKPPRHRIRVGQVLDMTIRIPPRSDAYEASARRIFQRPVVLYSLLPHAHYRGKAADFHVVYPDGTEETLLSVPDYDFNWQTNYVLQSAKELPAGTHLVFRLQWDNTSANSGNPDPSKEVRWGYQSTDEMMIGWYMYRYQDEHHLPGET